MSFISIGQIVHDLAWPLMLFATGFMFAAIWILGSIVNVRVNRAKEILRIESLRKKEEIGRLKDALADQCRTQDAALRELKASYAGQIAALEERNAASCRLLDVEADARRSAVLALASSRPFAGTAPKALDAINACRLDRTPLMNRGEWRLFCRLQQIVDQKSHRVWAQVPIGEVLEIVDDHGTADDRKVVNMNLQSKRIDFAITDRGGFLVAGIELQGSGHFQGDAAWRDMIKERLFRTAGIPLVEVGPNVEDDALRKLLSHALAMPGIGQGPRLKGAQAPAA